MSQVRFQEALRAACHGPGRAGLRMSAACFRPFALLLTTQAALTVTCTLPGSLCPPTLHHAGTTGLAACHLGGTTINSYAGIGRAEGSLGELWAWVGWCRRLGSD